jgi:hypothetical protein
MRLQAIIRQSSGELVATISVGVAGMIICSFKSKSSQAWSSSVETSPWLKPQRGLVQAHH